MPVSPSMRAAIDRYNQKFDDIKVRVPKGMRAVYKDFAASRGTSLNALIISLLEAEMNKADASK